MHYDYHSPEGDLAFCLLMLLGGAATIIIPIVMMTNYRIKRPERAKMVYEAYIQSMDNIAKQEANVLNLAEPIEYSHYAAADSAKYTNELRKFFGKNVDKIFTADDFDFRPAKVIDPNWIERNINHKAEKNKRFAERKKQFEYASQRYSNAIRTLNAQRRYKSK